MFKTEVHSVRVCSSPKEGSCVLETGVFAPEKGVFMLDTEM